MNIRGEYKFIKDNTIIYHDTNLITTYGETVFMNRFINDNYAPLTNILLGKGTSTPKKLDLQLGNETLRKTATKKYNIQKKTVTLTTTIEATEAYNVTEIGTDNNEKLCSHDTFDPLNKLIASDNQITIEYTFYFETGTVHKKWIQSKDDKKIYYTYEPNIVTSVTELETQSGYHRVNNLTELKNNPGAYYYNNVTRNLYITTTTGNNPGDYTIITRS